MPTESAKQTCQTCGAQGSPDNPVLRYLERVYGENYRWAWRCQLIVPCWARYDRSLGLTGTPLAIELSEPA